MVLSKTPIDETTEKKIDGENRKKKQSKKINGKQKKKVETKIFPLPLPSF